MKGSPSAFLLFFAVSSFAEVSIPYGGKLTVEDLNFHGTASFSFAILDGEGTVRWRSGTDANNTISAFVDKGRYLLFLGGQGMNPLPADLFLESQDLSLEVRCDLGDGLGLRPLQANQPITAHPYALAAELSKLALRAEIAQAVATGSITRDSLSETLQTELNATIGRDRLSQEVLNSLGGEIVITRNMLPQEVRDELNATITRERLSADVLADLNRTIGIANLSTEVTDKLNQTFSIDAGSITLDQLSEQVRDDINGAITRDRLSSDLLLELNRTITMSMLSQEVLDELNASSESSSGTTGPQTEVADGSITTNQLSEQILKYLKPEITQQPTASTIFADTNHTISVSAEGKYLTYQWKKNGVNLAGETNATLTITDANATQHDGNYSVVVSNDFGSVESAAFSTDVWMVGENIANLVLWLDASRTSSFELNNSIIENWRDLSGQGNDMNITDGNASLTGILNGRSVAYYDGNDITATTKNFSSELDQSGYSIVALSRYAGDPKNRVISSGYGPGSRNWLFGHHGGKHSTFFAETWIDTGITGDLNWHMFTVTHEPAISYNNGSDPLSSFWLDGTNRVLNSGLSSDTSPAPADIVFGGALNTEKSPCEVAEFIMVGAGISDSDRQKLEGYIAHKWGLSAILPSTHPYKN